MCFGFFSATFLDNFNRYVDDKYKTDIRKLTRNRKASFKDIMLYPLFQNGFTGSVEAVKLYSRMLLVRRILVFHNKILVNKEVI